VRRLTQSSFIIQQVICGVDVLRELLNLLRGHLLKSFGLICFLLELYQSVPCWVAVLLTISQRQCKLNFFTDLLYASWSTFVTARILRNRRPRDPDRAVRADLRKYDMNLYLFLLFPWVGEGASYRQRNLMCKLLACFIFVVVIFFK